MAEKEKEGETEQDPKSEGRPAPSIETNTTPGTSGKGNQAGNQEPVSIERE